MAGIKQILDCHVCSNTFNDTDRTPKGLPCQHTFCLACLKRLKSHNFHTADDGSVSIRVVVKCPECGRGFIAPAENVSNFPNNVTMMSLLGAVKQSTSIRPANGMDLRSCLADRVQRLRDSIADSAEALVTHLSELDRQVKTAKLGIKSNFDRFRETIDRREAYLLDEVDEFLARKESIVKHPTDGLAKKLQGMEQFCNEMEKGVKSKRDSRIPAYIDSCVELIEHLEESKRNTLWEVDFQVSNQESIRAGIAKFGQLHLISPDSDESDEDEDSDGHRNGGYVNHRRNCNSSSVESQSLSPTQSDTADYTDDNYDRFLPWSPILSNNGSYTDETADETYQDIPRRYRRDMIEAPPTGRTRHCDMIEAPPQQNRVPRRDAIDRSRPLARLPRRPMIEPPARRTQSPTRAPRRAMIEPPPLPGSPKMSAGRGHRREIIDPSPPSSPRPSAGRGHRREIVDPSPPSSPRPSAGRGHRREILPPSPPPSPKPSTGRGHRREMIDLPTIARNARREKSHQPPPGSRSPEGRRRRITVIQSSFDFEQRYGGLVPLAAPPSEDENAEETSNTSPRDSSRSTDMDFTYEDTVEYEVPDFAALPSGDRATNTHIENTENLKVSSKHYDRNSDELDEIYTNPFDTSYPASDNVEGGINGGVGAGLAWPPIPGSQQAEELPDGFELLKKPFPKSEIESESIDSYVDIEDFRNSSTFSLYKSECDESTDSEPLDMPLDMTLTSGDETPVKQPSLRIRKRNILRNEAVDLDEPESLTSILASRQKASHNRRPELVQNEPLIVPQSSSPVHASSPRRMSPNRRSSGHSSGHSPPIGSPVERESVLSSGRGSPGIVYPPERHQSSHSDSSSKTKPKRESGAIHESGGARRESDPNRQLGSRRRLSPERRPTKTKTRNASETQSPVVSPSHSPVPGSQRKVSPPRSAQSISSRHKSQIESPIERKSASTTHATQERVSSGSSHQDKRTSRVQSFREACKNRYPENSDTTRKETQHNESHSNNTRSDAPTEKLGRQTATETQSTMERAKFDGHRRHTLTERRVEDHLSMNVPQNPSRRHTMTADRPDETDKKSPQNKSPETYKRNTSAKLNGKYLDGEEGNQSNPKPSRRPKNSSPDRHRSESFDKAIMASQSKSLYNDATLLGKELLHSGPVVRIDHVSGSDLLTSDTETEVSEMESDASNSRIVKRTVSIDLPDISSLSFNDLTMDLNLEPPTTNMTSESAMNSIDAAMDALHEPSIKTRPSSWSPRQQEPPMTYLNVDGALYTQVRRSSWSPLGNKELAAVELYRESCNSVSSWSSEESLSEEEPLYEFMSWSLPSGLNQIDKVPDMRLRAQGVERIRVSPTHRMSHPQTSHDNSHAYNETCTSNDELQAQPRPRSNALSRQNRVYPADKNNESIYWFPPRRLSRKHRHSKISKLIAERSLGSMDASTEASDSGIRVPPRVAKKPPVMTKMTF